MNDFEKYCKNRIKYGLFRFIFILLLATIVFFLSNELHLFSDYVYALETETAYADMSTSCVLSNSGKYKSLNSSAVVSTNNVGTTYNGKSYGMTFYIQEDMLNTQVYNLKITFMSNDLLPAVNANYISIITYDTSCNAEYATLLSIEKNTSSGNATTLQLNFIPNQVSNKARILIGSESSAVVITGETTFGIRSLQIGNSSAQDYEQIITNQNQNTQNIINNNNQNAQDIINNQNENNQKIIDSNLVCEELDKNDIKTNGYLQTNGVIENNSWALNTFGITDYLTTDNATITVLSKYDNSSTALCFYDKNKTLLSCVVNSNMTVNTDITIPTNAKYFRATIRKDQNIPRFNYCRNGNQAITDSIKDLTETLTDTNVDTSSLNNVVGWLPAGPVDSIINLPLTLFNSLLSALNLSCTEITLPLPFVNSDLKLPCLGTILQQINGFWVWYETIGVMVAGIILYNYLLALYNWVDQTLSMRENTLPGYYEDKWGGGA